MNIPSEFIAEQDDPTWKKDVIQQGEEIFLAMLGESFSGQINREKLTHFVSECLNDWGWRDATYNDEIHSFAPATILESAAISEPAREKLQLLFQDGYDTKSAYQRELWLREGKKTKPKSLKRAEFNRKVDAGLEELRAALCQNVEAVLANNSLDKDALVLDLNLHSLRHSRASARENFLSLMRIAAQDVLAEIVARSSARKDVQVFEGGRSTSPLRKFVDKGGILHAVNLVASDGALIPREGEQRVDTPYGIFFVSEEKKN